MRKIIILAAACWLIVSCNNPSGSSAATTTDTSTVAKDKTPPQSEFGDAKYVDMSKKMLGQLSSGDVDGWLSNYSDNAMYRWSSGDSLAGKAAIATYWKERRKNVIDSISFSNDIWLSLKVNKPQKGPDVVGNWVLSWYMVDVKYKNGKKLKFWVHMDLHYDSNDKVDIAIQYIDRAPINAALAAKK